MESRNLYFLLFFLLFITNTGIMHAQKTEESSKKYTEKEKIYFLIKSVENLDNARFWRNGQPYDSKKAASHLRMKYKNAGSKIKTADQFIEYIASKSSATGEPYYIEFSNGEKIPASVYFRQRLKKLEML